MSDGAQRHGFGLYPGAPSSDCATLTKDEPGCTSIVEKLGVAGALLELDLEDMVPREGSFGSRPVAGPVLGSRVDTSTVPTYSTEPVVSGSFRTDAAVVGDWPRWKKKAGIARDSESSIIDLAILVSFIE